MKRILMALAMLFCFSAIKAQSITVTTPNGGEVLYACQTYLITWTATGTSNFYDIDYSLNNGGTWASIASNLNVTNGQYSWTVPNAESSICLVRVRDKNDITKTDVSNAVFTIHIPVVVTAPNGGESWVGGSQHLITWNIQGTSLSFNLDYSTNGGTTWTSITSNLSTSVGTYNWTVPNIPSTNCLVRVRDAVTNCMQDQSNNPFTVTAAQPILTYPNGGETFSWSQPLSIIWNSSTFYSTVRLDYSIDNGTTWTNIVTGATNTGSYSWRIPANINSTQCLVKASNSANVNSNDVSNAVFNIKAPTVTITAPNGGENYLGCNTYNVTYTLGNTTYLNQVSPYQYNFYLDYSTDGGASWSYITSMTLTGSEQGNYTASWTIPNGISSSQCLVRGYSTPYTTIGDTSNAFFTIQPNNVITVTAPNGGEVIPALSNYTITWTNTAGASGLYNVQYSSNNGSTWSTLASGISGNTYNWNTIPNNPQTTYLVRVQDAGNTCRFDVSNATFTVTAAQPILTYPNGGETFSWSQPLSIIWNSSTFYSTVRLDYSIDNGTTWTNIVTGATNTGSYSWRIPANINSTQCLVKASNSANVNSNDVSNAVFNIKAPTVTITAPNGGENYLGCNTYNVTYTLGNTTYLNQVSPYQYNFYLDYSTDGGASWSYITSMTLTGSEQGNYTASWTIPNGINSSQCLVRGYSTPYTTIGDTSNAFFTIQPNNVITVTAPNGGEVIPALSNYTITWTNTAGASGLYNVQYSSNNGSTWSTLASGISGNTYNWNTIPNNPQTTYLVRVQDAGNTCRFDVSNATFTVTAAQPILTYPNGGETFSWSQPLSIIWNSSTFYSTVRLDYSIDNGTTWTNIVTGATNTGSYSWRIPANINSTQCLVKASNSANVNSNDVSNAVFNIKAPTVTITAPNGGENYLGCNTYNVTYTLGNTTYLNQVSPYQYNFYLDYSTDGGASWSYITSMTLTGSEQGNYTASWTIPNGISSSQCLVRGYSTPYTTIGDTSNAFFTIQPNNVITVTAPNGGEVIPALSNYTITWTNTAGASGLYNVQYSSNNGSTWSTLASGISGNTYNWNTIPNNPQTTYLVRVQDAGNTCRFDVSNATFTVTAAQPILTYPNGGETFSWSQPLSIIWNSSTFYSTVRLDYSIDNGTTWTNIVTGATNTGSYSWRIPANINSTQCLVKASNSANVNSNDVSNAVFNIKAPTVTITAPNGGENYLGCNTYNVTYTLGNTTYLNQVSPYQYNFYLDYSTDGGASWSYITSMTLTGSEQGNYTASWTIPNGINSSQCLVRGYSTPYTTIGDTSNAFFTIQPNNVITVTAPNGGEVIPALSNYTITWTNTAGASGLYNVQYSSNNGSTWSTLASGISGNTYNWNTIPNNPQTTYLVRVQDAGNTCRFDVSNATFTVTAAQPILTYPNGGETFSWSQPLSIIWNSSTFYSTVRLDYSIDNGTTWTNIVTGATNTGSYSWRIPANINSTQCLVKASNSANVNSNDVSNAVFNIKAPTVTITAPNGGENYLGCNTYNVTYTLGNTTYLNQVSPYQYNFYLDYSTDGGASWSYITSMTLTGSEQGNYTASWTIPNGISSSQCLVRGYSTPYTTIGDTSNAFFTIQPNNVITVTAPNGGEVIPALSNYTITWTNTAGASGLYNVQYSSNNGSTWSTLASGISGNTYNWNTIPNNPQTTYLVRVQDAGNTCRFDVSNATFTVTAAQPILTYPNGGEQMWSGAVNNINWTASTFYSSVRLEYSLNNGVTWQLITASAVNTGTYAWTVPVANSTTCLVKASNVSDVNSNDVSNAVFTIKPPVKISTPNGLDQLGGCTQTTIAFEHSPAYTTFNIEYSVNNGTSWTTLVSGQTYSGTTGSYNWSIPNLSSTLALVRVYPTSNISLADKSDTTFTIKPSVTVILPSYGGVLQVGSVYQVKWGSDGISNLYDIAYSTSGNTGPWTNIIIAYNTATNTYNWTVPNTPSENCFIRVRDNVSSCKEDISDFAFAIRGTPAPITITNPNAVVNLDGCQNYTINWTESGAPVGSYNIDISSDAGITWSPVVSNYATTAGSYNWIVPNINTAAGLIKVSSSIVSTIFDISDYAFKINARSVTAKPDTIVCSGATVNLLATGGLGTYSWSPSTYLSSTTIANPVSTPASSIDYVVTSANGTCIMRDTAKVIVQQVPAFNITADATNTCGGQLVTFTAHVVNGGANPTFQWKLNGSNIGTNDSIFKISTLNNNDSVQCVLSYSPSCFAPLQSNKIGIIVNAKPDLGPDVTVNLTSAGSTVNLYTLYNTTGYLYAAWNTVNPAAAGPGIYRLIVSQLNGCTCPDTDTAFVYVNAYTGLVAQVCTGSNTSFVSDASGTTYQWQVNMGSGFVNLASNTYYSGINTNKLNLLNIPTGFYGYQYRCLVNGSTYSSTSTLKLIAYWSGAANKDWENTGNWNCGAVPDANTDVIIEAGKPNYPEINCNRVCRSISTAPNTSVKLKADKILMLSGKN